MEWHRLSAVDRTEIARPSILNFPGSRSLNAGTENSAVLGLVHELADAIQSKEDQSAQMAARAESLAQCAIDQLKHAQTQLQSSEIARNRAEDGLREANNKVEEFEQALVRIEVRIAAAESELAAAIIRAKDAEARAAASEKTLGTLENAIRQQLLKTRDQGIRISTAA
jgi:chromosome segregation ATPase